MSYVVFAPLLALFNSLTEGGALLQPAVFMATLVAVIIGAIVTTGPVSLLVAILGSLILFNLANRAQRSDHREV